MSTIRRIESDWLARRRAADGRARESALDLLSRLAEHLGPAADLTLVDLGAGTGANPAWLAPWLDQILRKPNSAAPSQHWLLLDHDPDLLAARDLGERPQVATSRAVVATVDGLTSVLEQAHRPIVVTCSALLDLLTAPQIEQMTRTVIESADAALLALSVTGEVALSPGHRDDELVLDAFNAHQQRIAEATTVDTGFEPRLAGPAAWRIAAQAFAASGWEVEQRPTPWLLGEAQRPLLRRLLADRVEAVLEQLDAHDPRVPIVADWWASRSGQIAAGTLRAEVGHVDLLALPRR